MNMILKCEYNWNTETVKFIYRPQGNTLADLDAIKDMQDALQNLYETIFELDQNQYNKVIEFLVRGSSSVKQYVKEDEELEE